jgi:hypothetical protein
VEILESRALLSASSGAGAGKRSEILESTALLSVVHAVHLNPGIGILHPIAMPTQVVQEPDRVSVV